MVVVMDCRNAVMRWTLQERQSSQELTNGAATPLVFEVPYWMVEVNFVGLEYDRFAEVEAMFDEFDGGVEEVEIWRQNKRFPRAIPGADANSVSSIAVASEQATVNTTAGLLSVGDMISYDASGSGRYVGRVKKIISTGANQTVCEARPPFVAPAGTPNARIFEAYGRFRQVLGSAQVVEPKGSEFGSYSATFRQVEPT